MAIYGYLWLSIGYLLVIFSIYRFVGVGYLWLSLVIYGYRYKNILFNTVIYGYLWLSYGYLTVIFQLLLFFVQ